MCNSECCKVVVCALVSEVRPSYVRYSGCSGVGVVRAVVRSDISIVFDEICALVVLIRNRVQVLDFVGQTVV